MQRADLTAIRSTFPHYPYPTLLSALGVAVDALDGSLRGRYLQLAVFDQGATTAAAAVMWGTDRLDAGQALAELADRSLLLFDGGRFTLHELHAMYLRHQAAGQFADLHRLLVRGYQEICGGRWAHGPDDGHFFQQLPWHLHLAGSPKVLARLLASFDWLSAKLALLGVAAVIDDFSLIDDDVLTLVRDALVLAAQALADNPAQLPGQLLGRIPRPAPPTVEALLDHADRYDATPWLRPETATLSRPGEKLVRSYRLTGDVRAFATGTKVTAASATGESTLLWDLAHPAQPATTIPHSQELWWAVVAFAHNGRILTSGKDHTIKVWDPAHPDHPVATFAVGHVNDAVFTSDGKVLTGGDLTGQLWDPAHPDHPIATFAHGRTVVAVATTGDGRVLTADSGDFHDDNVKVWDPAHPDQPIAIFTHRYLGAMTTTKENLVLTGGRGDTVELWDLVRATQPIATFTNRHGTSSLAGTADGMVLTGGTDGTAKLWDPAHPDQPIAAFPHGGLILWAVAETTDGLILTGGTDGTVKLWDPDRPGQSTANFAWEFGESSHAVIGNGVVFTSSWPEGTVKLWDPARPSHPAATFAHGAHVEALAATDDGQVVSGGRDGTAKLWDPTHPSEPAAIFAHGGLLNEVWAVAATPDGRVVTGGRDGTAKLWNPARPATPLAVFQHGSETDPVRWPPWDRHQGPDPHAPIVWVAGTRDGRILTSSSRRSDQFFAGAPPGVKLWDPVRPREPIATFAAIASAKTMTATSKGLVLTGGPGGTAVMWDPTRPQEPIAFFPHGDNVATLVAFGSDLVLTGGGNLVKLWDQTSSQQPIATFTLDHELIAAAVTKEGRILLLDEAGILHSCTLRRRSQHLTDPDRR